MRQKACSLSAALLWIEIFGFWPCGRAVFTRGIKFVPLE
jgi:hypothetical protein